MKTVLLAAILLIAPASCSTTTVSVSDSRSWPALGSGTPLTLSLARPAVDRPTDAASIEDEIERLAPLLFLRRGRPLAPRGGAADLLVEIRAVERELQTGWRLDRSVCVDLRVSRPEESSGKVRSSTPAAAARVVAVGASSLASSRDLHGLLSRGVERLCRELDSAERGR